MKNKVSIYFLIVAVLVIWGMIIYRLVNTFTDSGMDSNVGRPTVAVRQPVVDYSLSPDTTKLKLDYPDPFADTQKKDTAAVHLTGIKAIKPAIRVPKIAMNWDFVRYSGYIRNPGSRKLLALVHINGKETMMAEGETSANVKLLRNMGDSIKVAYEGKTKYITIKPVM